MSVRLVAAIPCAVAFACVGLAGVVRAETIHARFVCGDDKAIDAVFSNGSESRVRLSLSDGRRLVLPQARSASGARYANADESIVFWNKGDTAFIEEHGRITYTDCIARQ
jgi:membrane-bound inhibitor of C-type lysozyme